MGPEVEFPEPTAEEKALQKEQTELLRQQRDVLSRQIREQNLLAPFLFKEAGVTPIIGPDGEITAFEEIDDPTKQLGKDIELKFLERTRDALEGNLPVSPALERDLATLEETEMERLRRNLGPGFETSTPGQEGLRNLNESTTSLRDAARRGDLTLAEQLSESRSAINRSKSDTFFNQIFGQNANQLAIAGGTGNAAAGFNAPLRTLFAEREGQYQGRAANAAAKSQFLSDVIGGFATLGGAAIGAASYSQWKTDKTPIDPDKVLAGVKALQVDRWKYIPELDESGAEHIGPYAEDFKEAFQVGDGRHIHMVDAIGVLVASVQALTAKVEQLEKEQSNG